MTDDELEVTIERLRDATHALAPPPGYRDRVLSEVRTPRPLVSMRIARASRLALALGGMAAAAAIAFLVTAERAFAASLAGVATGLGP